MTVFGSEVYATTYVGLSIRSVHMSLRTLGRFRFFNKQEAIAAIIGDSVVSRLEEEYWFSIGLLFFTGSSFLFPRRFLFPRHGEEFSPQVGHDIQLFYSAVEMPKAKDIKH